MSVWLCIPSKRSPEEAEQCLLKWREMGYRIALWRDPDDAQIPCDLLLIGLYPGYHVAVNTLCREVMGRDREATWLVTAGDDMCPDPNKCADEIAAECLGHFQGSFGVMQPTGDRWGYPERICGSPWMGREFCRRMYGGKGPFCELYPHMWGDEEMHDICLKMGILWNREDLSHLHQHFQRTENSKVKPVTGAPAWMVRNNECYRKYEPVFRERKRMGFPGHQPCA